MTAHEKRQMQLPDRVVVDIRCSDGRREGQHASCGSAHSISSRHERRSQSEPLCVRCLNWYGKKLRFTRTVAPPTLTTYQLS